MRLCKRCRLAHHRYVDGGVDQVSTSLITHAGILNFLDRLFGFCMARVSETYRLCTLSC